MSRRTGNNSFGSVEPLGSGRFRARYTGPDGRRRAAPVTFASRRDAADWLVKVQADMLRGKWEAPEDTGVPLAEYVATWLRVNAHRQRPRTRDLYARLASRWLLPAFTGPAGTVELGPVPIGQLTPALVRDWHTAVFEAAQASANAHAGRTSRVNPARAWAAAQGLTVATTGRLSPTVKAAWDAAGRPDVRPRKAPRPGAGRTTTAQAYRLLHTILAQAHGDGLIGANPVRIAGAGHVDHAERIPLTPAEITALATTVAGRYRAAVITAAYSGLRPGELFALRRRDVDLEAAQLHVRQTLTETPGQPLTFGPPKTRAGRRTVALPQLVVDALTEHLADYTATGPDSLIFTNHHGAPVTSSSRADAIRRARARIDRPDLTWHHLRHTGATLAAQAGATLPDLMHRIGHTTTRAAAIYQHTNTTRDHTIAQALNALATADTYDPSWVQFLGGCEC